MSDLDEEEDFLETVGQIYFSFIYDFQLFIGQIEHMKKIEEAQSSVEFLPNQTFPFLKNLDLNLMYR